MSSIEKGDRVRPNERARQSGLFKRGPFERVGTVVGFARMGGPKEYPRVKWDGVKQAQPYLRSFLSKVDKPLPEAPVTDSIEYDGVRYGLHAIPVLKRENTAMVKLLAAWFDPKSLEAQLGWELVQKIQSVRDDLPENERLG